MKSLQEYITEAYKKYDGVTVLHFENTSAACLYKFELEGQISDGKYENSRPESHWLWVTNVEIVIDGNSYYEEFDSTKRNEYYWKRLKNYNLREWPGYIEKGGDYYWAKRVLAYGRIGEVIDKLHIDVKKLFNGGDYYTETALGVIAEHWLDASEKNTPFAQITYPDYQKKYINAIGNNINNERVYNEFCNTVYTIKELKRDLQSMTKSVNTRNN